MCQKKSCQHLWPLYGGAKHTGWLDLSFLCFLKCKHQIKHSWFGGAGRAINSTIKPWGTAVDGEVVSASHRIGGTFTLFLPNFENWTKHGSRDFLVPQVSVAPRSHTWFGAEALHFVHACSCRHLCQFGFGLAFPRATTNHSGDFGSEFQKFRSTGASFRIAPQGIRTQMNTDKFLSAGKQTNRPSFLLKYG